MTKLERLLDEEIERLESDTTAQHARFEELLERYHAEEREGRKLDLGITAQKSYPFLTGTEIVILHVGFLRRHLAELLSSPDSSAKEIAVFARKLGHYEAVAYARLRARIKGKRGGRPKREK